MVHLGAVDQSGMSFSQGLGVFSPIADQTTSFFEEGKSICTTETNTVEPTRMDELLSVLRSEVGELCQRGEQMSQQVCQLFVTFENQLGIHQHTDTLLVSRTPEQFQSEDTESDGGDSDATMANSTSDWSELTTTNLHMDSQFTDTAAGATLADITTDTLKADSSFQQSTTLAVGLTSKMDTVVEDSKAKVKTKCRPSSSNKIPTTNAGFVPYVSPTQTTTRKSRGHSSTNNALKNITNTKANDCVAAAVPKLDGKSYPIGSRKAFADKVKKIDKVSNKRTSLRRSSSMKTSAAAASAKKRLSYDEDDELETLMMSATDHLVDTVARMNHVHQDEDQSLDSFELMRGDVGATANELFVGVNSVQSKQQIISSSPYSPVTISSGYGSDRDVLREDEIDRILYGEPSTILAEEDETFVIQSDSLYHHDHSGSVLEVDLQTVCGKTMASCPLAGKHLANKHKQSPHSAADTDSTLTEVNRSMREIIADLRTPQKQADSAIVHSGSPNDVCKARILANLHGFNSTGPCGHSSVIYENLPSRLACQVTPPRYIAMSGGSKSSDSTRNHSWTGLSCAAAGSQEYCRMSKFSPDRLSLRANAGMSAFKPYRKQESQAASHANPCWEGLTSTPLVKNDAGSRQSLRRELVFDRKDLDNLPAKDDQAVCSRELYNPISPNSCSSTDSGHGSCSSSENGAYSGPASSSSQRAVTEEGRETEEEEEPIYETIREDLSSYLRPGGEVSLSQIENTYDTIDCSLRAPVIEPPELPPRTYKQQPHEQSSENRRSNVKNTKVVRWEDIVKKSDIVDMNAFHVYTVADVLESFDRLSSQLPEPNDTFYTHFSEKRGKIKSAQQVLETDGHRQVRTRAFRSETTVVEHHHQRHQNVQRTRHGDTRQVAQTVRGRQSQMGRFQSESMTHLNRAQYVQPIAPCRKITKSASCRQFFQDPHHRLSEQECHFAPKQFRDSVHAQSERDIRTLPSRGNVRNSRSVSRPAHSIDNVHVESRLVKRYDHQSLSNFHWTTEQVLQETYC